MSLSANSNALVSQRVVLRPYSRRDAHVVWEAIEESRPSLLAWTPDIGRHRTVGQVYAGLTGVEQAQGCGNRLLFGIWRRSNGQFIGEVGLHDIAPKQGCASVGYWLRVSARGQGLIDEALHVLHEFAFQILGLTTLQAHIAPENAASRGVAQRHGYLLVGARAADPQWDGEATSVLIYALSSGKRPE